MSSTDERIVQMRFDNKQFEQNTRTSIDTLDRLKKSLNLDASAKSLSNLDRVGKNFSLAGIASGVENISSKFTALGIVGITVLQNLTNSALNLGKRMVSALTIDPIKTGLNEYETKINAIQTILTNTQSKGTTLTDVNKALQELNTYADKTIYNFSEMTRNIGTFTAAGVDLNTSVTAIKGIANLAAGSGSNAQQASTAMYQLSQALASGSVKLQDWNSVVNAGMGGEMFQKALEQTAKELGHGRNMAVSFRDSLKDEWITTEVLTKTLQKFANDESLIQAATQVKTFTQLFDTMKESVQSGWAVSWENIIGNKDEAATLLTALSDAFNDTAGASADARNEMLSFWKANGGREAVLRGIANTLIGVSEVLEPIEEAFRDIFPAMTGKRLVEISKQFQELTSHFKMGEETSNNLKRTFKGLFALIDIGKEAFFAIAGGIGDFLKYIAPAGSGLLNFTGDIGDFIVSIDNGIKKTDFFNNAIKKIGDFMKPIADGVKRSVGKIIEVFKSFGKIDTSGIDAFTERVRVRFEPFTILGNFIKSAFDGIVNVVKKVAPTFYKLATIVGDAFGALSDNIVNSLDNADFNSIFDIVNGGLFAGILFGIKKFINSLTDITDDAGGFLGKITGILDGVKGSLEAFQSQLKANTLIKIAIAMGILSASLMVLSLIDSEKLTSSLVAMTAMFVDLFGSMAIFEKIMGSEGFTGMGKITIAMIGLSTAILILSIAMTNLSKLDWDGIAKGLVSVAALSGILIASAKLLQSNSGGLIKGSIGFVIFAAAINVLVLAVEKLSKLDTSSLAKGLIGVGVLAAELALFMKTTDLSGMGISKGLGLLALAGAILILSSAVKTFSELDSGSLTKGLSAMGAVLAEIAIFVNLTGNAKRVTTTAIGLTILGAAMLIFAKAIGNMGNLSWESIAKGLLTMAGSLAIITVAIKLMPKTMILQAAGLIVIAGALVILSKALTTMGGMTWTEIAKGLITLAGSLTIISIAMAAMTTALPGAAALLVVAGALAILAPVLGMLGSMSLAEIGKGLLALAGTFALIGIAGVVLGPLTPIIIALSVAISLLGVGCLAVGVGMLTFSAGLAALAVSGAAGSAALVIAVTAIIGLIPAVLKALAKGLIDFIKVLGSGAVEIAKGVTKIALAIVAALVTTIPVVIDAVFKLLDSLITAMLKYLPKLVDTGMKLIIGVMNGISKNMTKMVKAGIDVVVNFIKGVASRMSKMIQAGIDLMLSFINGMADGIRNNTDKMILAVENLMSAVVEAGGKVLKKSIKGFKDIGLNIVKGLISGIRSGISDVAKSAKDLGTSALNSAKKALGIHSPSRMFKEIGDNITKGLSLGIDENKDKAVKSSKKMSEEVTKESGSAGVKAVKKSNADAKSAFDKAVEWIDERKYYNKLSLSQELAAWENLQKRYAKGSEDRKKADREVYRVKNELIKKRYNDETKSIEDLKYYNKLSLDEELSKWKKIQSEYKKGTDERTQADKEVYRLKKEIRKQDYDDAIQKINDLKYYNKLSLADELEDWENIQKKYKKGTDERKAADKEVWRVKQEIMSKQKELDEDYYSKTKELNEKSIADIAALNDAYAKSVDDRANTLYSAYSLFDKVEPDEAISGQELISNLESQNKVFDEWTSNIGALTKKGIDDGLIKELENMGPSALAKIQALNALTGPELNKYVALWREKHNDARVQSLSELDSLRIETSEKISAITEQTSIDLASLTQKWKEATADLIQTTKMKETIETMKRNWNNLGQAAITGVTTAMNVGKTKVSSSGIAVGKAGSDGVLTNLSPENGKYIGTNMCAGIVNGLNAGKSSVVTTAVSVGSSALLGIKTALGIHSPSKEFEKVGMYSNEGFANGLRRFSGLVIDQAKNVGISAMDSLSNTITNISDIVSGELDMSPTIRPVLDLSNIQNGSKTLSSMFGNSPTITTSAVANGLVSSISNSRSQQNTQSGSDSVSSNSSSITNSFSIASLVVREEADIPKIARQLYNMQITKQRG